MGIGSKQGTVSDVLRRNNLLGEEESFPRITSIEQWRSPNTWRLTVDQLEALLNSVTDENAKLNWNLFSELPQDPKKNIQTILENQVFELPYDLYVPYQTPNSQD